MIFRAILFLFQAMFVLFVVRIVGIAARVFFGGFMQGVRPTGSTPANRGTSGRSPAAQGQIEELVKDPVCGVHTARSTAIAGRYQGAPAWFCSEECAAKAN